MDILNNLSDRKIFLESERLMLVDRLTICKPSQRNFCERSLQATNISIANVNRLLRRKYLFIDKVGASAFDIEVFAVDVESATGE